MDRMVKESERNVFQIYQLKGNGVVVHVFNSSTWEAKTNKTLWFQGCLGLHGETLSQKLKERREAKLLKDFLRNSLSWGDALCCF